MCSIRAYGWVVILGASTGFGLFKWAAGGTRAALWLVPCLLHLVIGFAMACVVLPLTRIYHPLERTTGFSFGWVGLGCRLLGVDPMRLPGTCLE
jgi:hypothetical protein